MKKIILLISLILTLLCLLFSYGISTAADATFSWSPNDDTPLGYRIHYGLASGIYDNVVEFPSPELEDGKHIETVTGLTPGVTYFFAATAYTEFEESGYSTEVEYTVPQQPVAPQIPQMFNFNKVVFYTSDGTKKITIDFLGSVTIEEVTP